MRRALFALLLVAPALASCEAILGLHDRTLRDAGEADVVDATACDGDLCACTPHAFCDDFDTYGSLQDMQKHWTVPGFQSAILQLGGTVVLDNPTAIVAPSAPNALLTTVTLPTSLQGAGFAMTQIDASSASVAGVHITMRMHVVALDPADGAPPLLDSGAMMFGGVVALIDFTSKNGVGIALSEQGAYVGYALDLLQAGSRLAQGKQFFFDNPKVLNQLNQYVPVELYVAKRSAITLSVECTQGPALTDSDGGIPDAAPPPDPVVVVVTSGATQPACEILGGELAFPTWLSQPVVALGSIVKGQGVFSVEFDNFTVDFLTQ